MRFSVGLGDSFSGIIENLFTGGPSAVIAILFLACVFETYFILRLLKKIEFSEKRSDDNVSQFNSEIMRMANNYKDLINELHTRQTNEVRIMNESISAVKVIMVEVKTLLSTVVTNEYRSEK